MSIASYTKVNKEVLAKHSRLRKLANSVKPFGYDEKGINIQANRGKRLFIFRYHKGSRKLWLLAIVKLA